MLTFIVFWFAFAYMVGQILRSDRSYRYRIWHFFAVVSLVAATVMHESGEARRTAARQRREAEALVSQRLPVPDPAYLRVLMWHWEKQYANGEMTAEEFEDRAQWLR